MGDNRISTDGGMDMLPAETVTRLAEYMLSINVMPDWRDDPTYNLRRTKRP